MSERASERRIPLSQFIRSFQTFDLTDAAASSSGNSLTSALRLSCSLAHEICKVEEETGRSPTPRLDWIDNIAVYSQSKNNANKIFDTTLLPDEDDDICIELLPCLFDYTENEARHVDGIIYSLGIVFYGIFSGGERPAELELKQIDDINHGVENGTEELFEDFNPFQQGGCIDPAALSIHQNLLSDYNLSDDDSTSYELKQIDDINHGVENGTEELFEDFNPFQQGGCIDPAALSIHQNLLSDYNLSDDDSTSYDFTFQEGDGPRKKRTQNGNFNMCSVRVELLKERGIPRALCDLIANMLDCANGTLRKDEAYHDISEVRDDLQLMLDKPSIYLHDQDMGSLSTNGLKFGGAVFGRNAELSTIKDAYLRAVSGDSEVVTIYGQSGTGKSFLACEFTKYVIAGGGIIMSGKFDQLQQGKPLSALASAFDHYCGILLQTAASKQMLAQHMNHVLGRDAYHLANLLPNLATILGLESHSTIHDDGCINAHKRLQYLLCRFVEVISSTFAAPITLFLDDLQWADSASIEAVNQLLLTSGLGSQDTHFFFLGCYREGDTDSSNPLWKSLCHNNLVNARSTDVKLDCMEEHTLNTMISENLCLLPRLTRTLSNVIYHKTRGNPLFVGRLMHSLNKEGLLCPSLSQRRWVWNMEEIQSRRLPEDVAIFLTESLGKLPKNVQWALFILSCFGASSESAFVKNHGLDRSIVENLEIAVAEGFLDKIDDRYRFAHDRVQEAAYNTVPAHERCRIHFNYGLELSSLLIGDEEASASLLFTAVNQLNLGGPPAVQDKGQGITASRLNLRAGKKAMEMSDYETAYSYFDNGISFLSENHWQEHYKLSLELFSLGAKCALTNSDHTSLKLLSGQVIANARSFEDKLAVMYFVTCLLASSSLLPESIEKGLDVLAKLGINLRGKKLSVEACVQETKYLLSFYSDDEILNTGPVTDPKLIMAMKFLGQLIVGMTQIMPESAPHAMYQIIQISLLRGMSPVSPVGFVHLGSYIAKLGDIREGYHYVKLAFSLLDKVGSRECAGEVICFGAQVIGYVEPLQATLECHYDGYVAAMASGDIMQAAVNILLRNSILLSGVNLQTAHEKCAESVDFMYERKMLIFMIQMRGILRVVLKLIGIDEKPKYESAEGENILTTNSSVMTSNYFQEAYTSFMFRLYDDTKHYTEKYLACAVNTWANLFLQHALHAFFMGLISFWLARKSREGQQQQWLERGKRSKLALKKWAESSQWTFENKWYLLEAEESYCNNDFDTAKMCYEKAISSAKDHKVRQN